MMMMRRRWRKERKKRKKRKKRKRKSRKKRMNCKDVLKTKNPRGHFLKWVSSILRPQLVVPMKAKTWALH